MTWPSTRGIWLLTTLYCHPHACEYYHVNIAGGCEPCPRGVMMVVIVTSAGTMAVVMARTAGGCGGLLALHGAGLLAHHPRRRRRRPLPGPPAPSQIQFDKGASRVPYLSSRTRTRAAAPAPAVGYHGVCNAVVGHWQVMRGLGGTMKRLLLVSVSFHCPGRRQVMRDLGARKKGLVPLFQVR